jgi:hypothetical protein
MKKYSNGGKAPGGPGGNVNDLLKYLSKYQKLGNSDVANLRDRGMSVPSIESRGESVPLNVSAAGNMGTDPRPVRNTSELLKELNSRARNVQEKRATREGRKRTAKQAYEFYQKNPDAKIEDQYERMFDSYFGRDWRESSKNRNFNQRQIYNSVNSAKVYLQ